MKNLLFSSICIASVMPFFEAKALPMAVIAQTCGDYLIMSTAHGSYIFSSLDNTKQDIVEDGGQLADSADFSIVWKANPNGIGGAILFPKDGSPAINCNLGNL